MSARRADSIEILLSVSHSTEHRCVAGWRQANRWGDYTGMTIDPDGETFWYLGEYAKDNGYSTNWGTYIAKFTLDSCGGGGNPPADPVSIDSFTATPGTIDAGP